MMSVKRKPLHEQLLAQADHLATKDKSSMPLQASLRRAVSAAYYALFHLLIHSAASSFARGLDRNKLRNLLSRAFDHGEMNSTCKTFASGGNLPQIIRNVYGPSPLSIPSDLQSVAEAFCELQKARHQADYSVHERFTRTDTIDKIKQAKDAFAAWERVRKSPMAQLFITCLLVGKKLQGR